MVTKTEVRICSSEALKILYDEFDCEDDARLNEAWDSLPVGGTLRIEAGTYHFRYDLTLVKGQALMISTF